MTPRTSTHRRLGGRDKVPVFRWGSDGMLVLSDVEWLA